MRSAKRRRKGACAAARPACPAAAPARGSRDDDLQARAAGYDDNRQQKIEGLCTVRESTSVLIEPSRGITLHVTMLPANYIWASEPRARYVLLPVRRAIPRCSQPSCAPITMLSFARRSPTNHSPSHDARCLARATGQTASNRRSASARRRRRKPGSSSSRTRSRLPTP